MSQCDSAKEKDLAARQFARSQLDGIFGNREAFGQKCRQSRVGPAIERRRMNGNLQLRRRAFAIDAGDRRPLGAGLGADGQRNARGSRAQDENRYGICWGYQVFPRGLKPRLFCCIHVRAEKAAKNSIRMETGGGNPRVKPIKGVRL